MGTVLEMNLTSEGNGEDSSHINFTLTNNGSHVMEPARYIYDRTDVRSIFITLYTLVFCSCFFGNLMVILVTARKPRSNTTVILTNLSVADLCVGIFCVYQNLTIYLIPSWVFGELLCKLYLFVSSLSYTASILFLTAVSIERYVAIVHATSCKRVFTQTNLRVIIFSVWLTSAIYSAPRFIYVTTIENEFPDGRAEIICILKREAFNSKLFDMINFLLLYIFPVSAMAVLYSLVSVRLWNSNIMQINNRALRSSAVSSQETLATYRISSSSDILQTRRRVVRMLILIVLTFAVCNLPYHARKIWQYWSSDYVGSSIFSSLFTPLTFLATYCNSAINPLIPLVTSSRSFQKRVKEMWMGCCTSKRGQGRPV